MTTLKQLREELESTDEGIKHILGALTLGAAALTAAHHTGASSQTHLGGTNMNDVKTGIVKTAKQGVELGKKGLNVGANAVKQGAEKVSDMTDDSVKGKLKRAFN